MTIPNDPAQFVFPEVTLSDEELFKVTGYKVAAYQLRRLKELGIPANRRTDGTVAVLRVHCLFPVSRFEQPRPQLKSTRRRAAD